MRAGLDNGMSEPLANLSAGRLQSFGFAIESAFGQRPMRYLVGRRFAGGTAVTGLFVLRPERLAGTHVWIVEDRERRLCDVQTFVPTMRRSVRLMERYIFDCLPLTDVGYLDLMAWRYPALRQDAAGQRPDMSWSRWSSAPARSYLGPSTTPGLTVTETTDPDTGLTVARMVAQKNEIQRRWEIVEPGDGDAVGLPRRIRAARRQDGAWMEFSRTGDPMPIPHDAFDSTPEQLREVLERRLPAPVS